MNVQDIKLDLINWLVNLRDETIIQKIRSLKESSPETDWYDILSEDGKGDIQKGLEDIANGRTVPHGQAMAKINDRMARFKNS